LAATSTDVSAFSAQHVAERAQRRRQAIENALAASAERHRIDAMTALATLASDPSSLEERFTGSSHEAAVAPPASARFVSEPPAGAGSYATLASAALDASRTLPHAPKGQRRVPTVVPFLFGFAVVMGASVSVLHPKRLVGASHTAADRPKPTASLTIPSSASARVSPIGAASSPPILAVSALPATDVPPGIPAPSVQWAIPEKQGGN
jgi:hypothetical protein